MACPPSGTRRRCRTGAPHRRACDLYSPSLGSAHRARARAMGPAPIVRRSMPVSSSRASAATCAARVPAVSPNSSGPPTWPLSAPPSSRPLKSPATCTSPKAGATIPPPPKPSASTASIRTEADIHGTRRSPDADPAGRGPAYGLGGGGSGRSALVMSRTARTRPFRRLVSRWWCRFLAGRSGLRRRRPARPRSRPGPRAPRPRTAWWRPGMRRAARRWRRLRAASG